MSYTITKESTGKVLVESTTLPPNYLPSDALVKQTSSGVEILNGNYNKIAGFAPSDVTQVDNGTTQTNPTTPTELFDALKTVFRNGGNSTPLSTTGWGSYKDTQYTEVAPFAITGGAAYVNLPNNGLDKLETQKPSDIDTFYDGTIVKGRNGDGLNVTLSFAVKPLTNNATKITVVPDIGGAVGEIEDYAVDITFDRGANVVQRYLKAYNAYTLDTWEANGATLKIKASDNVEIFGVRYMLTRTHKAI